MIALSPRRSGFGAVRSVRPCFHERNMFTPESMMTVNRGIPLDVLKNMSFSTVENDVIFLTMWIFPATCSLQAQASPGFPLHLVYATRVSILAKFSQFRLRHTHRLRHTFPGSEHSMLLSLITCIGTVLVFQYHISFNVRRCAMLLQAYVPTSSGTSSERSISRLLA